MSEKDGRKSLKFKVLAHIQKLPGNIVLRKDLEGVVGNLLKYRFA